MVVNSTGVPCFYDLVMDGFYIMFAVTPVRYFEFWIDLFKIVSKYMEPHEVQVTSCISVMERWIWITICIRGSQNINLLIFVFYLFRHTLLRA